MIKNQLRGDKNVGYRLGKNWSMFPDPSLPDQVTFAPVKQHWQVKINNIVLCEVQPENILVENRVLEEGLWYDDGHPDRARTYYIIGNDEGVQDGWCYIDHIFGKLVDAPPRPRDFERPDLEPPPAA